MGEGDGRVAGPHRMSGTGSTGFAMGTEGRSSGRFVMPVAIEAPAASFARFG
ncbi:hypothetical protein FHS47_001583 [Lutibacter sp. SG786]|nr:hypothetical protein [Luteibacter sp. SG786]